MFEVVIRMKSLKYAKGELALFSLDFERMSLNLLENSLVTPATFYIGITLGEHKEIEWRTL